MRRTLAAFLLFALPALAQAPAPQPAPLPPPAPAPAPKPQPVASAKVPDGPLYAGDLVILDLSGSVGDSVDCEIISPPDVTTYVIDSNGKTVAFANRAPGTYVFRVEAESVIGGRIAKSKQRVSFTTISFAPAPTPTPVPGPGPAPTPVPAPPPSPPAPAPYSGAINVVMVYDAQAMTPFVSSATSDQAATIAGDVAAQNATFYAMEKSRDSQFAGPYLALAVADKMAAPFVYLTSSTGKVLGRLPGPASEADILTAIKTARGAR